jgi:penicillin-binding protein 1C
VTAGAGAPPRRFVTSGHIVSGGLTLSMQLARLIEPRENRSHGSKIKQMRAIQIERRLISARSSSAPTLRLTAAISKASAPPRSPISARSRSGSRFRSSLARRPAAVPEKRRPDRNLQIARRPRRVLGRMVSAGLLETAGRGPH